MKEKKWWIRPMRPHEATVYDLLWHLGHSTGCHQLPERSFFWKGKQFPVCARCTGVFFGYLTGILSFLLWPFPWWLCLLLCFLMFLDWYVQYLGLLPSNNLRRLITGLLCGCGLMQIYLKALLLIIQALSH